MQSLLCKAFVNSGATLNATNSDPKVEVLTGLDSFPAFLLTSELVLYLST
jgi:hypothetical protein